MKIKVIQYLVAAILAVGLTACNEAPKEDVHYNGDGHDHSGDHSTHYKGDGHNHE